MFASSLSAGGAERVLALLANAFAARGHRVALFTLSGTEGDFFQLVPEVRRVGLDVLGDSRGVVDAVANNLRRALKLRRALREFGPEALLAFCDQANVLALFASRGQPWRVVVSERTHPGQHRIGGLWSGLRRRIYPWADAVVAQTGTVAEWIRREIGGVEPVVIANPVLPPAHLHRGGAVPTVIGMGRLSHEKGFDRLLEAFAAVAARFPEWRLKLLGDGPLRGALAAQAAALGIVGKVEFAGNVPDPAAHLAGADLFVLPSRYEGFPNALLEAMAVGLPVVGFDCPSGPSSIVRPGVDGVLVPPDAVGELARRMADLMGDAAGRRRLGANARAVVERFGLDEVCTRWEGLLGGVAV